MRDTLLLRGACLAWSAIAAILSTACQSGPSDDEPARVAVIGAPFGVGGTIDAVGGQNQVAQAGAAFASELAARVVDLNDAPVAGVVVTFTAPATSCVLSSATATTDADGLAKVTATALGALGAYDVSATAPDVEGTAIFHLTNITGPAAHIIALSGGGERAVVGWAFPRPLVVQVSDAHGNPVAGATVVYAGASAEHATFSGTPAPTGADGTTQLEVAAGTRAGAYDITATTSGASETVLFHLTNLAGPAAHLALISGSEQSAAVDTTFASPLVARVTDAHGNPVPDATVAFAGASAEDVVFPSFATPTDAAGETHFEVRAGTRAGAYGVTATTPGASETVRFELSNVAGPAAHIAAIDGIIQSAQVGTPFASPLMVLVSDAHGNPVADVTIAFAGASDETAIFKIAPLPTDATGKTGLQVTAGTRASSYEVTATVLGISDTARFSLTNTIGATAHIEAIAGHGQRAMVRSDFAEPLVVAVTDAHGNPVSGARVTFAGAGADQVVFDATPLVTDAAGRVELRIAAGSAVSRYELAATTPGAPAPATFSLANVSGPAAQIAVRSGDRQSAAPGSALASPLVVEVADRFGNPVPGVPVTFAVPNGQGGGPTASLPTDAIATDTQGCVSVVATAGSIVGDYHIVAVAEGVEGTATFSLSTSAGDPARLVIAGGDRQRAVVGTVFGHGLRVVVQDARGNRVPGVPVVFNAPGASVSLSALSVVSDVRGEASVIATAGQVSGGYVVVATAAGLDPVELSLANIPGAVHHLRIADAVSSQSAIVGTAFAAPLEVIACDYFDNPVPGVELGYFAPPSDASAVLEHASVVTDDDGSAWTRATAGSRSGTYHVTVFVVGDPAKHAAFTLTNLAAPAKTISAIAGTPASTAVGTAFAQPLTVRVSDAAGNPVKATRVVFTQPAAGASARLRTTTWFTDEDGRVQVFADANEHAGSYAVSAFVAGATGPAIFDLTNRPGAPVRVSLSPLGSPQATRVGSDFAQRLELALVDAFDNPASGVDVLWSVPASGPSAHISADRTTTGPDGKTAVMASANAQKGVYHVSADIAGLDPVRFELQNLAGPPASLVITGTGRDVATVGSAFAEPLAVVLTDSFDNPIAEAEVVFSGPTSGPAASFTAHAKTDLRGRAYVVATADHQAGPYVIQASTAGVAYPAVFALLNVAAAPARIVAEPAGTPQSALLGSAFSHALAVTVQDAFGNPVPAVAVTFTRPPIDPTVALSATVTVTDRDGRAEVGAIAGEVPGAYRVRASAAGVSQTADFALENRMAPGVEVSLLAGVAQTAMATSEFAQPLSIGVTDSAGRPIADATVMLTVVTGDLVPDVFSRATGADGRATFAVTAGRRVGRASLLARVAHGAEFTSGVSVSFTVAAVPTITAIAAPARAEVGAALQLSASVSAEVGAAPPGVFRFFAGATEIGSAPVGADGFARIAVTPFEAGTFRVEARFEGAEPYLPSVSQVAAIEVGGDDNELADLVAGGGGGCAGGGGERISLASMLIALLVLFARGGSKKRA